jgi:hypothetical protein
MSEAGLHLVLLPDHGVLELAVDMTGTLVSLPHAEGLCSASARRGETVVVSCRQQDESSPAFRRLQATGATLHRAEPWERAGAQGMSSLMFAALLGDVGVVDDLLGRGADVNGRDDAGWTALMHASRVGHRAVVDRLLRSGARVDVADGVGATALIEAARCGHRLVVEALVRARADTTAAMSGSGTARALAAAAGHLDTARFLPFEARSGVRCPGDPGAKGSAVDCITFVPRRPSARVLLLSVMAAVVGVAALAIFVAWDVAIGVLVMLVLALGVWCLALAPLRLAIGPAGVLYRPGASSVLEIPWSAVSEIAMSRDSRTTVGFLTAAPPVFTSGRRAGAPISRSRAAGPTPDGRWITNVPLRLFCRPAVMTVLAHRTLGTGVRRPSVLDDWL